MNIIHFLLAFVNSIRFATCLNQKFCKGERTDDETKKSNRRSFFQQKYFCSKSIEKHEGDKWRKTKKLIKTSSFCFAFFVLPKLKSLFRTL